MWNDRYSFIIAIRNVSIKEVSLAKKVSFEDMINFLLTEMTTLNNGIRLIKISFSAIALLMTIKYIIIVTFFVFEVIFEADESRSLIYNKLNVFRVRNSYKI